MGNRHDLHGKHAWSKRSQQPQRLIRRTRAGMTLVELIVALTVLVIGLLGFLQSTLAAMALQRAQREDAAVNAMARQTLANLQGTPFAQVFMLYNSSAFDDPMGTVAPGANIDVPGLRPLANDPDGFVGLISFPIRPVAGAAPELRENLTYEEFGTPRDLNSDGQIDGGDKATTYRILPVQVSFDWLSSKGPRHMEFRTILAGF